MPDGQTSAAYQASCLSAGRYDLLVAEYAYPLTLFLPGRPPIVVTPEAAWGFFQAFHAALVARGMVTLRARVTAEGLPIRGRSRLWTDWHGTSPSGHRTLVAQTVCYRRIDGEDARTEMLEYTRLDLPMLAAA